MNRNLSNAMKGAKFLLKDFIKKNGGLENGYGVFIEINIIVNGDFGVISLGNDFLQNTLLDVKEKRKKLSDSIRKKFEEFNLIGEKDNYTIKIKSKPIGDGCYEQTIYFTVFSTLN